MTDDEAGQACDTAVELIANTKAQIELLMSALPKYKIRASRLVLLKLDEARLWMQEARDERP